MMNMLGTTYAEPYYDGYIAQRIDGQDPGNMFSGLGGGIDLSRMIQQMMAIVSRSLGGGSAIYQQAPAAVHQVQLLRDKGPATRDNQPNNSSSQVVRQHMVDRINNQNPTGEIFHSSVESVVRLYNDGESGASDEGLVDLLFS